MRKRDHQRRLNAVAYRTTSALSLFEQAAVELEEAAEEATQVAVETDTEATRLLEVRDSANQAAQTATDRARKIREFTTN